MKSANWISATGRSPFIAAPIDAPTIIDSVSGVSMTRSSPNSAHRPSVARNTPPFLPTSSPRTTTDSSRRISSAMPSRTASMNVRIGISATPRRSRGCGSAPAAGRPPWDATAAAPRSASARAYTWSTRRERVGIGLGLRVVGRVLDERGDLRAHRLLDLVAEHAARRAAARGRSAAGPGRRPSASSSSVRYFVSWSSEECAVEAGHLGLDERRSAAGPRPLHRLPARPRSRRARRSRRRSRPASRTPTPGRATSLTDSSFAAGTLIA